MRRAPLLALLAVLSAGGAKAAHLRRRGGPESAADAAAGEAYRKLTTMPVQVCSAYPGTRLDAPPGGQEDGADLCRCVADPGVHDSKAAWSCPPDMALKYERIADTQTGATVAQWHCVGSKTETVETFQPLQCPAGWESSTNADGEGVCTSTTTECDEDIVVFDNTEYGLISKPQECPCTKSFVVTCSDGATYDSARKACVWQVEKITTIVQRPLNNYLLSTPGGAQRLTISSTLGLPEMIEGPPCESDPEADVGSSALPAAEAPGLDHTDWKIVYHIPVLCPLVIPIQPSMLVCGPQSSVGIMRTLRAFMSMQSTAPVVVPKPKPATALTDTWTECNDKCALIYARATECALDDAHMCTVTSATPGVTGTGAVAQTANMEKLATFIGKGDSKARPQCLGYADPWFIDDIPGTSEDLPVTRFLFGSRLPVFTKMVERKSVEDLNKFSAGIAQQLYVSAEMGTHAALEDRLGRFEELVRSILDENPKMYQTPCLPYVIPASEGMASWSMRRMDGSCLTNHKRHVDWERTLSVHRDQATRGFLGDKRSKEGLAVENPFAVDCRAYATGVFKKAPSGVYAETLGRASSTFLSCKRSCDQTHQKSKRDQVVPILDAMDAALFPENVCACGQVWVHEKATNAKQAYTKCANANKLQPDKRQCNCVAPDPSLRVLPPGFFGSAAALQPVRVHTAALVTKMEDAMKARLLKQTEDKAAKEAAAAEAEAAAAAKKKKKKKPKKKSKGGKKKKKRL